VTRGRQYVTLKVYTCNEANQEEFQIYKHPNQGNQSQPGYAHVRRALDIFTIPRHGGYHHCLVQKPMWESFRDLLYRNPNHQFTEDLLKIGFMQVFLALDYPHTECKLVHTGKTFSNFRNDQVLTNILIRHQGR
jgi:serine/threonine protein kinase